MKISEEPTIVKIPINGMRSTSRSWMISGTARANTCPARALNAPITVNTRIGVRPYGDFAICAVLRRLAHRLL